MAQRRPEWLKYSDQLTILVVQQAIDALQRSGITDPDLAMVPHCALLHFAGCLRVSSSANEQGLHSVAMGLLRQCVETLTLVDVGLQSSTYAEPLLSEWRAGAKSQGAVRVCLERDIWQRYGTGIWTEPWTDFFGNLSKAVQPYAHYTPQLMEWQFAHLANEDLTRAFVRIGPDTYDAIKASRITLLNALAIWTLGRLLLMNSPNREMQSHETDIDAMGRAIGKSKLLFYNGTWQWQLLSGMLFQPGYDWRDD